MSASQQRSRHLATIVEGHVRRTLLIPAIYRRLGLDDILTLMPGDERALMEALVDREKVARFKKVGDEAEQQQKGE